MGRSQESFGKKEKEKKRLKKRQDKQQKKEERKAEKAESGPDDMIAYLDEDGNITDTPPDPLKRKKKIDASSIEIGVPKREHEEIQTHFEGKVSYFDTSKGFGFIIDTQSQEKYFFHVSGILEEVTENDKVAFELERGPKGMNAVKVKKI